MRSSSHRRPLTTSECITVLRDAAWGVLAVVEGTGGDAVPIAVPTAYAFDGEHLSLAMTDGRKRRALLENPRCCLTVADIRSLDAWRSVAVVGRVRLLVERETRAEVATAFLEQSSRSDRPLTSEETGRLAESNLFAVEIEEVHGFASTAAPCENDEEHRSESESVDAMNALRRIVSALRGADANSVAALGVTTAQLFVLREIAKAGVLTVGTLARRTATAQSSVSEVVARVLARGLISRRRSAMDGRRAELTLTDAGRTLLAHAPVTIQERLLAAFTRLPADDRRAAANALRVWIAEAGLDQIAATMFFEPWM